MGHCNVPAVQTARLLIIKSQSFFLDLTQPGVFSKDRNVEKIWRDEE